MLNLLVTLQMFGATLKDRISDDDGAVAIEYALIAVVIALGLVAGAGVARDNIAAALAKVTSAGKF